MSDIIPSGEYEEYVIRWADLTGNLGRMVLHGRDPREVASDAFARMPPLGGRILSVERDGRAVLAEYAAVFPGSQTRHAIDGEFDYSRMGEARTVCGRSGPFHTESISTYGERPAVVDITCDPCARPPAKRSRSTRAAR
jgi:hypothetical protein